MQILRYAVYRFGTMLLTLLVVSVLVFVIINLPPGDYLSNQIAELQATGQTAGVAKIQFLRQEFALDEPLWKQYLIWVGFYPGPHGFSGLIQGNLGWSFYNSQPVAEIVGSKLWATVALNVAVVLFIYAIAVPLGVVAAARSRTWIDYTSSFIGYLGLATPNFLLALILYYYGRKYIGLPIGGLMDPDFEGQPLSWDKIKSVLLHLIVPTFVIGTAGVASMMQRLRANMLDELGKPYVETAVAKGMVPSRMLAKYPLRVAFNPFVADIGNLLPTLISGSVIISVIMSLPTIGPDLLTALKTQDQFLAGFVLMFVALLTLIGTMISDVLLIMLDPRIRYEGREA